MQIAAVDAGQSGTRAVVVAGTSGRSPIGSSGGVRHLARTGAPEETASRVVEAIGAAGSLVAGRSAGDLTFDTVAVGMSGFDADPVHTRAVCAAIRRRVAADRVVLTSDAVTSYLGAIGPSAGVVVAGGTGLVCLAADGRGAWAWVDGAGYLLGDEGGGSWIGRRGLREAVRRADGRGGSTVLAELAERRFGSLSRLPAVVYASEHPAALLASFVPDVGTAAAVGDPAALSIWMEAADAIACTIRAGISRVLAYTDHVVAACTGALFTADLPLADFVRVSLRPEARIEIVTPRAGALDGAVTLADAPAAAPLFPGLVHVFDRADAEVVSP